MLRRDDNEALEFVNCLGAANNNGVAGRCEGSDRFAYSPGPRAGLMSTGQGCARSADRGESIIFCSARAGEPPDLDDVFSCLSQFGSQTSGEASRSLQRPDPPTGAVLV